MGLELRGEGELRWSSGGPHCMVAVELEALGVMRWPRE